MHIYFCLGIERKGEKRRKNTLLFYHVFLYPSREREGEKILMSSFPFLCLNTRKKKKEIRVRKRTNKVVGGGERKGGGKRRRRRRKKEKEKVGKEKGIREEAEDEEDCLCSDCFPSFLIS